MKTRKILVGVLAAAITVGILSGCGSSAGAAAEQEQGTVMIYAAKSMTDCMDELIGLYGEEIPEVEISVNYASSGDLQSQIENGAPCDIFLSAAQKQMDELEQEKLIDSDSRSDLLTNEAVLVVPADSDAVASFEELASDSVERVAVGDPQSVPAGQYAQEILTALGIWDTVYAKAVLGSDVRQVLAWCETGEVDAGIVYATDAAITDTVRIVCSAPADSCAPVVYPAALTLNGAKNEAAAEFLAFLQSDKAAAVFEAYGFGIAQ